jgi:hypothetical protein
MRVGIVPGWDCCAGAVVISASHVAGGGSIYGLEHQIVKTFNLDFFIIENLSHLFSENVL